MAKKFSIDEIKRLFMTGQIIPLMTKYGDIALAGMIIAVLVMIILPLPFFVLDILLTLNITISVVLLMVTIYVPEALRIASFPTILLVTTLFRLGLEISSTRLIMLYANAGEVIKAFGDFVVGGNFVVGFIMFAIITIIQFLVIAKGAERVSEVAARFTLDAMPGKQMSIDADLRAGNITMEDAKKKRRNLERENQLFGSMDGAMKFVKGDVIAGMIITVINLVGGLVIGVMQKGMTVERAAKTYTLLSIGEGLVAQIPALLISLSAGMIVTRVAAEEEGANLGREIGQQVLAQPKAIAIASGLLLGLGLIPGLPKIPFFILALATGSVAYGLFKLEQSGGKVGDAIALAEKEKAKAAEEPGKEEELGLPLPAPLVLEVSTELTALLDGRADGGRFVNELIPQIRDRLFFELGVRFPGVRIRGSVPGLNADTYAIKLNEIPVIIANVNMGQFFVNDSADSVRLLQIEAQDGYNPMTHTPGAWVPLSQKEKIEKAGMTVIDIPGYIVLHMGDMMRKYAYEFLGIQEVQAILDQMEQIYPALVKETVPKLVSVHLLTEILKRLVQEDISIADMRTILQAIALWAPVETNPTTLTEYVRTELKRYISFKYTRGQNSLVVYLLDPEIEEVITNSIRQSENGNYLALEPETAQDILKTFDVEVGNIPPTAQKPVVITTMEVRRYLKKLVELHHPEVAVLSFQELAPEIRIQPIARISLQKQLYQQ
jgi:type III secretion protein V